MTISIDVGEATDVRFLTSNQTVSGVLHAAGVLRDKMLRSLSADQLDIVASSKTLAAAHIRSNICVHTPLHACVFFSSWVRTGDASNFRDHGISTREPSRIAGVHLWFTWTSQLCGSQQLPERSRAGASLVRREQLLAPTASCEWFRNECFVVLIDFIPGSECVADCRYVFGPVRISAHYLPD
jgi:hypothetical protein